MDGSVHEAQRDGNGRFVPGCSGNPAGKKPGTRNRATVLREALGAGEDIAAARIVIDKALSGDLVAARFVVGRLEPPPRGRPIELDLPQGASASDIVAAYDVTVRAMATGEITPDEALQVSRVLDGRLRALKLAARARKLARTAQKTEPSAARGRGPFQEPSPASGRGGAPAFRLHFADRSGAIVGTARNAPYWPQPYPGGSP
jgi:hypothetical protein